VNDLAYECQAAELLLIEHLKGMVWQQLEGQTGVPYLTERQRFRDMLLTGQLRAVMRLCAPSASVEDDVIFTSLRTYSAPLICWMPFLDMLSPDRF
jgi:hypothetical protein